METAIIYTSKYGFTKEVAETIQKKMDEDVKVLELENVTSEMIEKWDEIIWLIL